MTETQRLYSGRLKTLEPRTHRHAENGRRWVWIAALAGCAVAWACWITRDSQSVAGLIPAGQKYHVVCVNLLENRAQLAQSPLWGALPPTWGLSGAPEALARDPGIPRWILNNLIGGESYATGNDTARAGDLLFLTRMTRIGTLLERVLRWAPGVEGDYAGGLRLRHLTDAGLFYAVRGRVLAVSPSREALIRAVTLTPDQAMAPEALARLSEVAGAEQVRGTIAFAPGDPLSDTFQFVSFALRVDPAKIEVSTRAALALAWQERAEDLLAAAAPKPLVRPPEGFLTLSADFGLPVEALWPALCQAMNHPDWAALWKTWAEETPRPDPGAPPAAEAEEGNSLEAGAPEEPPAEAGGKDTPPEPARIAATAAPSAARLATAILGPLGPGLRLSVTGVDVNEMFPVPLVVAHLDGNAQEIGQALAGLPSPPPELPEWAAYPRYDPETRCVHVPLIGGPSLEPTAAAYGQGMLLSLSRPVGEAILAEEATPEALPEAGNLYVAIRPRECVKALVDSARLFAELNLLRGQTPESFEQTAAAWQASAERLQELSVLAKVESGMILLDARVLCAQAQ